MFGHCQNDGRTPSSLSQDARTPVQKSRQSSVGRCRFIKIRTISDFARLVRNRSVRHFEDNTIVANNGNNNNIAIQRSGQKKRRSDEADLECDVGVSEHSDFGRDTHGQTREKSERQSYTSYVSNVYAHTRVYNMRVYMHIMCI